MELMHGGDVYSPENRGLLDFSANINPLGLPESVRRALLGAVDVCAQYPDPLCRNLRRALGVYEHLAPEQIFCSNGASEIFYRIIWALRPRNVLICAPTFSEYRQAAESAGCTVTAVPLGEEYGFRPNEHFFSQIKQPVDLVFFCNPNNPTGIVVDRKWIEELARRCREAGAMLVVDECFMDFVPEQADCTAKPLLEAYKNLLIVKAFTKIFAMPGVRLGYCLTKDAEMPARLYRAGPCWSVSAFAQSAGAAAGQETAFVAQSRSYVAVERDSLRESLLARGLHVTEARANFLLLRAEGMAGLRDRLHDKGILVRSCSNFEGLDTRYIRIAVRRHEENRTFLRALEEVL